MENQYLHEVAITGIIIKDGKYLLIRRSPDKKRFPSMWVVPGGKLEGKDYLVFPKDTKNFWYRVLERTLEREVLEEVGLKIKNVRYLTSITTIHKDGVPSLIISFIADYDSGEVSLNTAESSEFAWVNLDEAKNYDLIDGIYDELVMAENKTNQ